MYMYMYMYIYTCIYGDYITKFTFSNTSTVPSFECTYTYSKTESLAV